MMLAGSVSVLAMAAATGVGFQDLVVLPHGSIFGGAALSAGSRFFRDFAPEKWKQDEQLKLTRLLKNRRNRAMQAIAEHRQPDTEA